MYGSTERLNSIAHKYSTVFGAYFAYWAVENACMITGLTKDDKMKNTVALNAPRKITKLPRLQVPSIDTTRKPKPYLRAKSFETWVKELPIGNSVVAAHQVLTQLRHLNTQHYPVKERMALLHLLRPTLQALLISLKQPLRQTSLPLDEKHQYTADLIQELLAHMAVGYKLIVTELSLKDVQKFKAIERVQIQEAVYLAIVYLSLQLIENFSLYAPPPPQLWMDINQLYQYAEAHMLHRDIVDEPYPDTPLPVEHTIDFAYKRIILLALAEPYHLMECEVEDMYRLIAPSAPLCTIEALGLTSSTGQYVIDLLTDAGPRYITTTSVWQPADGREIKITAVKTQLETHLQRILRANMQSPSLESTTLIERQYRDMLLRLADAWSGALQRRIQRFSLEGKVQLTSGLNACHHFISGELEFTPAMDELKLLTNRRSSKPSEGQSIFATAYREALQNDRRHGNQEYAINPWWQRDISPIGISLNCSKHDQHMYARVGELVAYRFMRKNTHRWRLGVIRWLQVHPASIEHSGQFHIGIMNLATGGIPVAVKGTSGVGAGTDYFRGLFVPRQVALDQVRSLIVPALMYDVNSVLALNMKERLFHVRLTRVQLSTRSFAQFDFEIVKPPHLAVVHKPD